MALSTPRLVAYAVALVALFAAPALHAACNTPAGEAGHVIYNTTHKVMQYCNGSQWVNTGAAVSGATQSGCSSPSGQAGEVIYASNLGVIQFCNGQNWVDTACATTRNPNGSGCSTPAGTAGDIHYATTANELQFCDSTNWVAMGWPCGGASMVMISQTILSAATAGTNYTVPAGATEVRITAWGAGGAGMSYSGWSPRYVGGGGGFAEGTAAVTAGETLTLRVGKGGPNKSDGVSPDSSVFNATDTTGANGGGYSSVFRSSTPLLIAGGGGAGGTSQAGSGAPGGGGGGLTGQSPAGTTGGTQSAGGSSSCNSENNSGSYLTSGGTRWISGGSGYYGGAGCYINYAGGGSSYIGGVTSGNTIGATGQTAANNTNPDYIAGKGVGGNNSAGGDGLLIVRAYGPGSSGGNAIVATATAPSGNGTIVITHPAPGHAGTVTVYLAGTNSRVGNWWNNDSKGGTQGSGQTAVYTFTTTGAETSFSLTQTSDGSSSGQLALVITGGTNNGRKLVVGSANGSGGYGAAGAASDYTGSTNIPGAVLVQHGSSRPHNATISYSDNTNYSPSSPASYGSPTTVHYAGPNTITMRNADSPGGMQLNGTEYGSAQSTSPPIAGAIRLGGVLMHFQ